VNPNSEPVAKVAGRTIYKEEVPKNLTLEAYIKRLVFFELASEKGYDDSVRAIVERSFDEALVRELYYRVTKDSKPTLAEPYILYRLLGKEVKAQLIVTEDFMSAYRAWAEVVRGEDFGEVSTKYSYNVRLKNQKGDIGYLRWNYNPSPLIKKVFNMKEGEITFPFKSNEGWNVVKVLEIRDRDLQDFSNMEEPLKGQMNKMKTDMIANEHINFIKWILDIEFDNDGLNLLASRVPITQGKTRGGLKPEFKLEDMDKTIARTSIGSYKVRDFVEDIRTINRLPQFRNRDETVSFIQWRIIFRFLVMEAKKLGVHRIPKIADRLKDELIRMTIRRWKAYEIEPLIRVTDEDRMKYYEENKEKYRVPEKRKVYLIEVETKDGIYEIYKELQTGKDFEKLATQKSIGRGKNKGGFIGFIGKNEMGEIGEVAFKLNQGEFSEPFEREDRWNIIKVTEIEKSHIPEYKEVRYRLNKDYERYERDKIEDKIFEENKERFKVEIFEYEEAVEEAKSK
jgi:peptidyl-prolyl cis-trans isomerase C